MKLVYFLPIVTILFFSMACEEESSSTASVTIPDWLQEQIEKDEKIIEADPKRMQNYGAWIRFEFNQKYYFEYKNPLSSLAFNVKTQDGKGVDITQSPFINYQKDKCCKQYMWKASKYLAFE